MKKIFIPILSFALLFAGCSEDFLDPTKPSQELVVGTRDGIIGAANGLQQLWSVDRLSPVYSTVTGNGFTTKELRLINAGNVDEGESGLGIAPGADPAFNGDRGVGRRLAAEDLFDTEGGGHGEKLLSGVSPRC